MKQKRNRFYLGLNYPLREIFTARSTPTDEEYGNRYKAVIGPFRTKLAAKFMQANPRCITVSVAEKSVAKKMQCALNRN